MHQLLLAIDSTQVTVKDSPGWGAAEWIAIITAGTVLLGTITTMIVQIKKMRSENTSQHAEGRALVTDVRDRLLDVHESIHHIDEKVDKVAERLEDHERSHTQGPQGHGVAPEWRTVV